MCRLMNTWIFSLLTYCANATQVKATPPLTNILPIIILVIVGLYIHTNLALSLRCTFFSPKCSQKSNVISHHHDAFWLSKFRWRSKGGRRIAAQTQHRQSKMSVLLNRENKLTRRGNNNKSYLHSSVSAGSSAVSGSVGCHVTWKGFYHRKIRNLVIRCQKALVSSCHVTMVHRPVSSFAPFEICT